MAEAALLHCPIRGPLRVPQRAKDGLAFTEEKRRIDAIKFLLHRNYPLEHFGIETTLLRFGHKGKNSFRVDFTVYDIPAKDAKKLPPEEQNGAVKLAAEIKRDHGQATEAKATQVKPALAFLPDLKALGVYWDDVEQRFYYRTLEGTTTKTHEAPISKIPGWGSAVGSTVLTYADLDPARDLVGVFDQLEDTLHTYVTDKSKRYAVMMQLLLVKIHDENLHKLDPKKPLNFQDFSSLAVADSIVQDRIRTALAAGLEHYQRYLPQRIPKTLGIPAEALRRVSQIIAPVNLLASKKEVIQAFYMKFAKNLYKWDLAQYFTPHEVIDFIVDVVNPQYGEHIKDPACGSSDFLVSAFRAGKRLNADLSQFVWGADNSEQAVQISVLNMVLNGDGKSNIKEEDSLEAYSSKSQQFSVVLCNPPFGTKIVEKRFEVLRKFDTAYEWTSTLDGQWERTEKVRESQQTGILFAELCVRLAKSNGRIGIIMPNGYLGNRSAQYVALREWLLRHTRLVGVVSFPRFTFKKSGADVSASVMFLEKREKPLAKAIDDKNYRFFVGMIESVGWRTGDKLAVPIYRREMASGDLILDENNEPILDADFPSVMDELLRSPATDCFPWLLKGRDIPNGPQGWSVSIEDVVDRLDLSIDPKRLCPKYIELRDSIKSTDHIRIGDVVDLIESDQTTDVSEEYKYVEIQNIGAGDFDYEVMRGWQLPDRAKLFAQPGDLFIAHIWGCSGKWFIAPQNSSNLIVTNGCTRVRLKQDCDNDDLLDLVVGLCSEAFKVQMRALTTGSDGLAEISDTDLLNIVLPKVTDATERKKLTDYITTVLSQDVRFSKAIGGVLSNIKKWPVPASRKGHWALV